MSARRGWWTAVVVGWLLSSSCSVLGGPVTTSEAVQAVRTDPDDQGVVVAYTGGSCDTGTRLAVTETTTQVQIRVAVDTPASGSCDDMGHPRTVAARLAAPVGSRQIVDVGVANSSITFVPFPGVDLQEPAVLPAGFSGTTEVGNTTVGAGRTVTETWTLTYRGDPPATATDCPAGRGLLTVTEALHPGDLVVPSDAVDTGTRNVAGVTGRVWREDVQGGTAQWLLVWSQHGRQTAVTSSGSCNGDRILGPDDLLAVAASLKPLSK